MPHPHLDAIRALALHQHLGLRGLEAEQGTSRLEITVNEANVNPMNVLHGGVIYSVLDVAAYAALVSVLADDEAAVTHDIHVSCMSPVAFGRVLTVEGRVAKKGRTLAFVDATATCEGKLVASARVTKSIVPLTAE